MSETLISPDPNYLGITLQESSSLTLLNLFRNVVLSSFRGIIAMACAGCLPSFKIAKRRQVASRAPWYALPFSCILDFESWILYFVNRIRMFSFQKKSNWAEYDIFSQACHSSDAFGTFHALIAISVSSSGQISMVPSIRSTSLESTISG